MKQKIRNNVFETNSSSVHSLTILPKDQFDKFQKGEIYMDYYGDENFYTKEQIENFDDYVEFEYDADEFDCKFEAYIYEKDLKNYENYGMDYETFQQYYKSKSGDEIVAFGYFGHD